MEKLPEGYTIQLLQNRWVVYRRGKFCCGFDNETAAREFITNDVKPKPDQHAIAQAVLAAIIILLLAFAPVQARPSRPGWVRIAHGWYRAADRWTICDSGYHMRTGSTRPVCLKD